MDKQVIIIGGGVAGLAAGYWCEQLGLKALVLERGEEPGGQLLWTFNPIKNYLAVDSISGKELRDLMVEQVSGSALEIRTGVEVSSVKLKEKSIELADGSILKAEVLVIATGIRRRKLNIEGEKEFAGKGILISGGRDKESVRGKDVAIIGGGDAAFENALILAETANSVVVIHRSDKFRARREFREQVENDARVKVLPDTIVEAITGNENIERLALRDRLTGYTFTMPAQAALIRIGVEPNTELFLGQIDLDEKGFVMANNKCETSLSEVYAAGDVASPHSMTVNTAAGMGVTVANVISENRER